MKKKNLSPLKMFVEMAQTHVPEFRFSHYSSNFKKWKSQAKPKVLETLGKWPASVAPNPELLVEWEDRGVQKRKYLIEVGPSIAASLQVNLPVGLSAPAPTLLCWHGHGEHGKDAVMGNMADDSIRASIKSHNYDYGHQMAKEGFITFAIDWIGCGERNDNAKPHFFNHNHGRDWCNLYYLNATMLGMTSMSINLSHGRAATDFAQSLPEVDPQRLGVMGLSGGGTMALWTALTDERFKAAEIICYSGLWADFGLRDLNYCGMQVAPGLYGLVDLPDLQGLLAPLPLLVDIGIYDDCFRVDGALECFRQLQAIYQAASAESRLNLDQFPGGHAWGGNRSVDFFTKYL